jgi:adenylate cyclase
MTTSDLPVSRSAERSSLTILAADIAGYTALTQANEDWTFARVTAVMSEVISILTSGPGRIVDRAGDGLLAAFPSAVEALNAALAVRDRIAAFTAADPEGRRISFRIGINLGEVIISDGMVFGTVVNVASRLQNLAEPGGIIISGAAHEATRGAHDRALEDLGGLEVRGLEQPVRCFRVRSENAKPVAVHPALPDKPSIAVLPFANLSDDPDEAHFVDGLVTDLIATLSSVRSVFVVARNSSFRFRDRTVPLAQIGRELGVRYLLDGTVRRGGQRLRVTGELLEAETGQQLWSDRFDGNAHDIFGLQDKVTETVAAILQPRLLFAEVERVRRKPPENLQAHDLFLRATGHFYAMTHEDIERAKLLTDRALRLDPDNPRCLALGARCRLHRKVQGWVPPTDPSIAEGGRMGLRAAALAGNDAEVLWMAGIAVALAGGDVQRGVALIDRALAINPNSADALTYSGMSRAYLGDADTALQHLARAHRLSPVDEQTYNKHLAAAFATFGVGRYEESLGWSEQSLAGKPDYVPAWRIRAASLGLLGLRDEGREAVLRVLALSPDETCTSTRIYYSGPFQAPGAVDALVEGLRRAGLPAG